MPTSPPSVHRPIGLLAALCCGLVGWGCQPGAVDGYHEVTQAEIDAAANSAGNTAASPSTATDTTTPSGSAVGVTSSSAANSDPPVADPPLATTVAETKPATTAKRPGTATSTPDQVAREIKLLVKDRAFKVEGPEKAWRISFDDFDLLKILNMDPVPDDASRHMPAWLKQLDGKRIRVRGFMYPTFQDPVSAFVLARDNQICCFGRNPKIYDLVRVAMRDGKTSAYIQNRPFDVVGRFRIAGKVEDGKLLYSLDDAIVIDR